MVAEEGSRCWDLESLGEFVKLRRSVAEFINGGANGPALSLASGEATPFSGVLYA
jgi:hypothetical protein